jgi:predicted GIY-YIG superfamily endonuclease
MTYILYKATSPSGRMYIGITNNFKRRMKEHRQSNWPFGQALRKYGQNNFTFEFETFSTVEEALDRERELVTPELLKSKKLYNACVGGILSDVLAHSNPMHNPDIVESHPNMWTTTNNPMNNADSKRRMIENQNRRPVCIDGVIYPGVREACRQLNTYRQFMIHRIKSPNYPTWTYAK